MITTLHLSQREVDLVTSSMRTSATWTLDAMGSCISHHNEEKLRDAYRKLRIIERIAKQAGRPQDNSYRLGHLREQAERIGVRWPV